VKNQQQPHTKEAQLKKKNKKITKLKHQNEERKTVSNALV